ncbi:MAG: primosomal protein N' [Armatimonadota bacterium]
MYASVIVDCDGASLSRPFTYRVPDELEDAVFAGACVAVPFSGRKLVGYIFELTEEAPELAKIKDIHAVVSDACAFNPSLLNMIKWMSDYYIAPLAHSMRAIVPETMSATVSSIVRLIDPDKASPASPAQLKIAETLFEMGGTADLDILKAKCKIDKYAVALRQLNNRGCVDITRSLELPKARPLIVRGLKLNDCEDLSGFDDLESCAPMQAAILKELADTTGVIRQRDLVKKVGTSSSPIRALIEKGLVEKVDIAVRRRAFDVGQSSDKEYVLTSGQRDSLSIIREGQGNGVPQTTLVYGVTGSGKTEVYLQSIADVLKDDRTCISLVPEIALTNHLMDAYISRFGDKVAILHSRLSAGERYDEWRRIESGEARIVLGARSGLFAPVRDLGLVVIDEEHEPSYKQDRSPRYNARRLAEERANNEEASVILGSATPSIETFYRASTGDIKLAVIDKRIEDRPLPIVRSVDLRDEFEHGRRNVFSEPLQEGIAERMSRGEQVILFVNRRGYSQFMLCRTCGHTAKCENCDVSLTYHANAKMLRCHHCDESLRAPDTCPKCGSPHFKQFGIGTERVEEEVRKLFPEANVIRMDADTTRKKNAHASLLKTFKEGKASVLVGTQMVAKGLDFPNVTLVGVISADTILNLPDFRSAERTFQLLTQVSGRAGRGEIPGEVVVQSFSPDHYAIRAAARQDYLSFYGQEIAYRRELNYPPFSQLINIISSDAIASYADERLREFVNRLDGRFTGNGVSIMGPVPAPVAKLKGLYRSHLLIRSSRPADGGLQRIIYDALDSMSPMDRTGLTIDVDPLTML